jgi:hypothetical protein
MMSKLTVKSIAKRILGSSSELQSPKLMHPVREWFVGLAVATTIMLVGGVWSAQTYLQYQDVSLANEDSSETPAVVYRASLVEAALAEFAARNAEYEALLREAGANPTTSPVSTSTEDVTITDPEDTDATTTPGSLPAEAGTSTDETVPTSGGAESSATTSVDAETTATDESAEPSNETNEESAATDNPEAESAEETDEPFVAPTSTTPSFQ